jgi:photosystem II stability/assembly factor-like uncharacterized protein
MIGSMKNKSVLFAAACAVLAAAAGCEKKKTGGGGGGGSWVIGQHGLMANIHDDGSMGDGYDLQSQDDLLDITCRGKATAFVVGQQGTLLRTFDGGDSWESIDLGTTTTLRSVSAHWGDAVFVGGDGILKMSPDSGATWRDLSTDASRSWLSVTASHHGNLALAVDSAGGVWQYDTSKGSLASVATLAGARQVAASPEGTRAVAVGAGHTVLRSDDAGAHWRTIDLGRDLDLYDVVMDESGAIVAVGAGGTIANISATDAVSIATPGTGTLRGVQIDWTGHGMAVGENGLVLSSSDSGVHWSRLDLGLTGTVFGVDDVDGDGHL